jgi:hypothetical protein
MTTSKNGRQCARAPPNVDDERRGGGKKGPVKKCAFHRQNYGHARCSAGPWCRGLGGGGWRRAGRHSTAAPRIELENFKVHLTTDPPLFFPARGFDFPTVLRALTTSWKNEGSFENYRSVGSNLHSSPQALTYAYTYT